jgi:hypothetical protein
VDVIPTEEAEESAQTAPTGMNTGARTSQQQHSSPTSTSFRPYVPTVGLPAFSFELQVPEFDFARGDACTGQSTYSLGSASAPTGSFTWSVRSDGALVGTGRMEHDLIWDSPNFRRLNPDGSDSPIRMREPSDVEFEMRLIYTADVNEDACVDSRDLSILLANWGAAPDSSGRATDCDLNVDGRVDAADVAILLQQWTQ